MWYIVAARKGAQILAGLQGRATRQQLVSMLDSPEVENLLQVYPSLPGDAYFITSGTLHAIGGGNLILEIQQNSDTTYRVSDWGRVDAHGNPRELHVEKGIQSINFMNRTSPRVVGVTDQVSHNRKFDVVSNCPFFTVTDLRLTELWTDPACGGRDRVDSCLLRQLRHRAGTGRRNDRNQDDAVKRNRRDGISVCCGPREFSAGKI